MRRSPLAVVLELLIRAYRVIPKTRDHCRYHPTCSAYGLEAVRTHGGIRGGWLTVRRLSRCHPWGGTGLDPVPPRSSDRIDDLTVSQVGTVPGSPTGDRRSRGHGFRKDLEE